MNELITFLQTNGGFVCASIIILLIIIGIFALGFMPSPKTPKDGDNG